MPPTEDDAPWRGARAVDELESPFVTHEPLAPTQQAEWQGPLDALGAESPFTSALELATEPVGEEQERESEREGPCAGVIGDENRVSVADAWRVPYRWICQISVRSWRNGKLGYLRPAGTGVLLSPRFVLTAAHLLRSREQDAKGRTVDTIADDVVVTPGRDDDAGNASAPFGQYKVRRWSFAPGYSIFSGDAWRHDYALLELHEPAGAKRAPILNDDQLCFWGSRECGASTELQVLRAADLEGARAHTAGYPYDLGRGTRPYSTSGILSGVDVLGRREIMNYNADVCNGQSGSPVWVERNGRRCLVGIVTTMGTGTDADTKRITQNRVVRLTQEVFEQISRWLEGAMETPWLKEAELSTVREGSRQPEHEEPEGPATLAPEAEAPPGETLCPEEEQGEEPASDEPGDQASFELGGSEHQVPPARPPAPWAQAVGPFPTTPTIAFLVNDKSMLESFAKVASASTVKHLCAALVDLSDNALLPPYVGLNDDDMVFAGSMLKVCAMYAAFALRSQVQELVDAAGKAGAPVVAPDIISEIEAAWRPKVLAKFPTKPTKSFGNNLDITFPRLDKIFDFLPSGRVEFRGATAGLTDAQLDQVGEFGRPRGQFYDWMRAMMRWSNNTAASFCILALGYFYINGALDEAGLFDSTSNTGLWLSADYAKHDWVESQKDKNANAAGQRLTPRWAKNQGREKSNLTATAAQAARLMTLIAQDGITGADKMRTLMQSAITCVRNSCGIGSYVKDGLSSAHRSFAAIASKKGFGDDSSSHECAIVERVVGGKPLRYAVVGLGSLRPRRRRDLSELFVRLDDVIAARHP